jgi:hypothetical protein
MFEGLAEHILVELAAYIGKLNEMDFLIDNINDIYSIVTELLFAVQKVMPIVNHNKTSLTMIKSLLNNFSVGTEKGQLIPALPLDRNCLQPLRLLDRQSSTKKASERIYNNNNTENTTIEEVIETSTDYININEVNRITPTQYTYLTHMCWEIARSYRNTSNNSFLHEIIGYQMIAHRSILGKTFSRITRAEVPSKVTLLIKVLINTGTGDKHGATKKFIYQCR